MLTKETGCKDKGVGQTQYRTACSASKAGRWMEHRRTGWHLEEEELWARCPVGRDAAVEGGLHLHLHSVLQLTSSHLGQAVVIVLEEALLPCHRLVVLQCPRFVFTLPPKEALQGPSLSQHAEDSADSERGGNVCLLGCFNRPVIQRLTHTSSELSKVG